ncbi:MAG TPA: glycosyltransferase family 2 protein [Streptosporangiaceae bacterium]|nr:glycosyltransferase family 2 protein [Streptosporangiaceae bacterium]
MTDHGGTAPAIAAFTVDTSPAREPARRGACASVVVCVYTEDRWQHIQWALASLTQQTALPGQVIVVADHNPELGQRLSAAHPDLEVIPSEFSPGLSGARNTGVQYARGDIVVFLDDDARAEPRWLEAMLAAYDDESVLGVGGLVVPDWRPASRPRWLPDEFLWVVGCSYRGLPETKAEIRNPLGANMSFRKAAFQRAGPFDSSVGRNAEVLRPLGCEETEFSIRLRGMSPGGRIMYEPRAVVHHHVAPSRGTWAYFLDRCYSEGRSKARVARLSGASAALSSERSYVLTTVRRAVVRELAALFQPGGRFALARIAALAMGVTLAGAGYAREMVTRLPIGGKRGRRGT